MKKLNNVLIEISELTNTSSSKHPGLYRLLDKNMLKDYLRSLQQLLNYQNGTLIGNFISS